MARGHREIHLRDGQMQGPGVDRCERTPLKFMPYVANLFKEVTGKDLQGLGQFTGWIGLGGYYH